MARWCGCSSCCSERSADLDLHVVVVGLYAIVEAAGGDGGTASVVVHRTRPVGDRGRVGTVTVAARS
jgi:hypothetical protein